jgi:hypothetical protein
MVDRLKDKEDLILEALFRSEAIADGGFSAGVVSSVRRHIWMRRLTMPVAFLVGAGIAFNPLSQLVRSLSGVLSFIPQSLGTTASVLPVDQLPQLSTLWMVGMLVVAGLMASRLRPDL